MTTTEQLPFANPARSAVREFLCIYVHSDARLDGQSVREAHTSEKGKARALRTPSPDLLEEDAGRLGVTTQANIVPSVVTSPCTLCNDSVLMLA
jgi:hypothetical protein